MFEQVVKLSPDSFMGYSNLGGSYLMQGRYQEAIQALQHSVSVRPTPIALSNLATAYFDVAQFAEAAQIYEAALKLDDRRSEVWGNLGDAYYWAPGKREQAAAAYQKAVSLANEELKVNPRDASLWGYLATYDAMLGEKQQALSCLEHALQLAPKESELLFNAALVHNQFHEKQETLKWLRKALAAGYPAAAVRDTPNFQNLRSDPRFVETLKRP